MSGNPMRWACAVRGCFNVKKRPKINQFHDCFERGINFGDVDGIVEVHGHFLMLEWKEHDAPLSRGQRLLHAALLAIPKFTIIRVVGDAETMVVRLYEIAWGSRTERVDPGTLSDLKARIHSWFLFADHQLRGVGT